MEVWGSNPPGSTYNTPRLHVMLRVRKVPSSEGNNPQGPYIVEKKRMSLSCKREPVGRKTCGFVFARYYIY